MGSPLHSAGSCDSLDERSRSYSIGKSLKDCWYSTTLLQNLKYILNKNLHKIIKTFQLAEASPALTPSPTQSAVTGFLYFWLIFVLMPQYGISSLHLYCVTRAPILYKELSSPIFQSLSVSQSVRHPWHLSRSPLCAIYKGINALYWPSIINYQLLLPHSVLN